jgi:hypothetical protein
MGEIRGHDTSVSEIEFCTLYVVAERWIFGCILRFMHAENHFSDTLIPIPVCFLIRNPVRRGNASTRYLLQQFQLYAGDAGRGFASWSAACDGSAEQSFKTGHKLCCAKRSPISFFL